MVEFFRRHSNGSGATNAEVDPSLDIAFYKAHYPDLAALSEGAAATHWRLHGRREGRLPNPQTAILRHPNFPALPQDFDPAGYVYSNRDLTNDYFDVYPATMHYLQFGMGEARLHKALVVDDAFVTSLLRSRTFEPSAYEKADTRLRWLPQTLDQYLYFRGFSNAGFVDDLDPEFYFYTSGMAKIAADRSLHACVLHFVEKGIENLCPISATLLFDPHFYRKLVRPSFGQGLAQASDVELYRRWLSKRDFHEFPPNHRRKMQQSFGVANSGTELNLQAYRIANTDLRSLDDEMLLEQLFNFGLLEQRTSIKIDESNVMLFTRFADHLQMQGRLADAERLYFRLVHLAPDHTGLNQRLGDFLVRRERYAEAFQCYNRNIQGGQASKWGYLNAAACCERLADLKGSMLTLDAGCHAYPDDQHFLRQRQSYAERYFADEFSYARAVATSGQIRRAQNLAFAAAALCDFAPTSEARPRHISSIALFANMDLAQCTLYRVEQKAEQLIAAGYGVKIFDWSKDQVLFERSMASFDMVIFFRVAAFPGITRLVNGARAAGLVTVYDVDDLIFDEAEFPEPFAKYAGQVTPAEYVDICMGVPLFRYAMELCDYAIASTPSLARRMEPFVRKKRAFVHRNALGLRHKRACEGGNAAQNERGPTTIFYGSGTKAHKGDFETILLPALEEIDRRFGNAVRFVFAGHRPVAAEGEFLSRVQFVEFTPDIEDFWDALSRADINLSVIGRTPATDAKSEIKWLEAAMFGIPSVVSATDTFSDVIDEGIDGFLAVDSAGFIDKIAVLVSDRARRRAVGEAARSKALREYGMDALTRNLRDIIGALEPKPLSRRTRVLVVNVFYPPQTKGGATRVVVDNVADLRELYPDEFEFEIFTTLEGGQRPYDVHVSSSDGVRTTAMTAGDAPSIDLEAIDTRAGEIFKSCVERFDPHLIHFHCVQRITAAATETALLKKIPYIITAHDGWWISDRQFLYDKNGPAALYDFNQLMRHRVGLEVGSYDRPLKLFPSLRGAEAILAVSEPFAKIYSSTGLTNVRAVPNGMPRVSADLAPTRSKPTSPRVRIAHIGGTSVHKGYQLLKYAIFAVKPAHLSMTVVELGLQPGEEQLEDWNGTPVRVIAKRPQSDVNDLYDEIDVLFAPSLWPESYGLVTREALAAGCWVVASDRGAVGEPIVENVNGHVVSVDTLDGLIQIIGRIDADPTRYKTRPPATAPQRTSRDQARDLAEIYRGFAAPASRLDLSREAALI